MYLNLQMMRDALGHDETVRFKEETVDGREFVIVSYMIANDDLWRRSFGAEARGITFDKATGECVSRPFHKFFNVGEKEFTQPAVLKNIVWTAYPKIDGSMITPVMVNGKVRLKTKKSFYSNVAREAQANLDPFTEGQMAAFLISGWTPIYEYTSPTTKIVVQHDKPAFKLLAGRSTQEGHYLTPTDLALNDTAIKPEFHMADINELLYIARDLEGVEGWVLVDHQDGYNRVKIKTEWYNRLHRVLDLRVRDVVEWIRDEKLDDMMPNLLSMGVDTDVIRSIENRVVNAISDAVTHVKTVVVGASGLPLKEAVQFIEKHGGIYVKACHRTWRTGCIEPQMDLIVRLYFQYHLQDYELTSIGNPNFGGKDG
ncbi:RNA ligase [Stenotrophomonas maltophilia phage vB_SmaM_Ps15]|uniref:RNA ligase n=1 Tax=Stenotrophomonas maltophilia phage vB_SmaM_Ps15 TaxID=3071007 RepID=A0AAE9FMG5_9CAUD|nr:RNA ligase [Stenotrophomonas maltophilia phage vB_SmaM_Ps15]UMO77156.1 RNA ligase [Stenotrophomonas maltophilia phage vB_SmaM_Ps15]